MSELSNKSRNPERPERDWHLQHRTVAAPEFSTRNARRLRKDMSLPEVLLWQQLRTSPDGLKFRRQFPRGRYVLDFACLEVRLAVEIDGEAHGHPDQIAHDAKRDEWLRIDGFAVLRIPAIEVLRNLDGVVAMIVDKCRTLRPLHHPADGPPPRSGEELL